MARRTIHIQDELDDWIKADLEHGDSYSAVVQEALEQMKERQETAENEREEPTRSEPADFGHGESTGVQEL